MKNNAIPLDLAPMAGAGDRAFREVVAAFGATGFTSEMISAKAVVFGDRNSFALAEHGNLESPFYIQLFGSEPETVAGAAEALTARFPCDGVDLNFGCPVPKITKNGEGSALMRTPEKCRAIVAAVKEAVRVPVSVKMRVGWDENSLNAVEVALACEEGGASRLTVHGRTRADLYRDGTLRPGEIAKVVRAVKIPVLANGDVRDGESAAALLAQTGAAGLAVGRGALGSPWIFSRIRAALNGETPPEVDKRSVMRRHVALAFAYKPFAAAGEMRTHMAHYLRGFRGAAALRGAVSTASTPADYEAIIRRLPPDF